MESTCVNVQCTCICGMNSLTIEKHVVMLYTLYMYVHKTSSPFVFGNNFCLSHINVD